MRLLPRGLVVTYFLCCVMLYATATNGQEILIAKLWTGEIPGPAAATTGVERDTTQQSDGMPAGKPVVRLIDVANPEIHIYKPSKPVANGAACVICPGGGFNILAWDLEGIEAAQWLNSLGVTAVVLKYRVPTKSHGDTGRYVGPVNDAQRALSMTRAMAEQLSISGNKIGILGFSAGGMTAAIAAMNSDKRQYAPTDLVDEQSCKANYCMLAYPAYLVDDAGRLKDEFKVTAAMPPTFFVHAQDDRVTSLSSTAVFNAMTLQKIPAELHIFSQGGHGYGLRPTEMEITKWPMLTEHWLRSQKIID